MESKKRKIPDGWYPLIARMKKRIKKEKEVKEAGGNKFQQLEARLTDEETGKLTEDIVIYAIRTIDKKKEVVNFLEGYIENIKANPKKYPAAARRNPKRYAIEDVAMALNMHFRSQKTHKLWGKALYIKS